MIYTIERANLIIKQLQKFTDSYNHMVAGQFANIEFWVQETASALKAIDEHKTRFKKMYEAQKYWIDEYDVKVPDYCHICNGICELSVEHYVKPQLPKHKANIEKAETRRELVDALYYFLIRCFKVGLLDEDEIKIYCDKIGTGIDPNDLYK